MEKWYIETASIKSYQIIQSKQNPFLVWDEDCYALDTIGNRVAAYGHAAVYTLPRWIVYV